MGKFECGCHIVCECINLNSGDYKNPSSGYLLETFVNVCGKCGKKQMKFQQMENKLMEMEKQRMEMFMNYEEEDTYFDLPVVPHKAVAEVSKIGNL